MNSAGSAEHDVSTLRPETKAPESKLTGIVAQTDTAQVIQEGLRVGDAVGQVRDFGDRVDRAVKDGDRGVQEPRRVRFERDLQYLFPVSVAVVRPVEWVTDERGIRHRPVEAHNSREELFQVCERLTVARGLVWVGLRSNKLVVPTLDELKVALGSALADDGQDDVFVPADCVAGGGFHQL